MTSYYLQITGKSKLNELLKSFRDDGCTISKRSMFTMSDNSICIKFSSLNKAKSASKNVKIGKHVKVHVISHIEFLRLKSSVDPSTQNWLVDNCSYEDTCLKKKVLFHQYSVYCKENAIKPVTSEQFCEVVKNVFSQVNVRKAGRR